MFEEILIEVSNTDAMYNPTPRTFNKPMTDDHLRSFAWQ